MEQRLQINRNGDVCATAPCQHRGLREKTLGEKSTKQAVCLCSCFMGLPRGSVQGSLKKSSFALLFFPLSQCKMLVWTLGSSLLSVFPEIVSERSWERAPVGNPGQGGCWGGFSLEAAPSASATLKLKKWNFIHAWKIKPLFTYLYPMSYKAIF